MTHEARKLSDVFSQWENAANDDPMSNFIVSFVSGGDGRMVNYRATINDRLVVSIAVGRSAYCTPRTHGPLDDYQAVEVGVLLDDRLVYPSAAGVAGFDGLFQLGLNRPVAPQVAPADVLRLYDAIEAAAGEHRVPSPGGPAANAN